MTIQMPPSKPEGAFCSTSPLQSPRGEATENLLGGLSPLGPSEHTHLQSQASTSESAPAPLPVLHTAPHTMFPRVMSTPWAFEEPPAANPPADLGLCSPPLVLGTCRHVVGDDCLSLLPSPSRTSILQVGCLAAPATGQRLQPGVTTSQELARKPTGPAGRAGSSERSAGALLACRGCARLRPTSPANNLSLCCTPNATEKQ